MFVQLQFDQEARRAMILQIGNFKGNVIFCRFLSWFLLFEYLFERSDFKGSRAGLLVVLLNNGASCSVHKQI